MSLYYNDETWVFDKLKENDLSFVLIKKLFVSNIPHEFFSVEQLTKEFRKYGEIEKIELKTNKNFEVESTTDFPNYAYITFKDTVDAYKALKENDNKEKSFIVQPANTWKQPIDPFEPTGIDYIGQLDDYCLLELFDRIPMSDLITLTGVSVRFNSLLHDKIFQNIKEAKINCDDTSMTLAKLRRTLLAHGKYVNSVVFILPQSKDQKMVDRMVDLFTKHIGDNVSKLDLKGITLTTRKVQKFKRLFERLKVLKWTGWQHVDEENNKSETFPNEYYNGIILDYLDICVNLEKLTITQPHRFATNTVDLPNLKKVHIGFQLEEDEQYKEFFKSNPQITCLKLSTEYFETLLDDFRNYLTNLEKLKVYEWLTAVTLSPEDIEPLIDLRKLRVLKIQFVNPKIMDFLLENIGMLPELEEVELVMMRLYGEVTHPYLTVLKTFAEESQKVKKFRIGYYKLTDDAIIDMIRFNRCLEVFDICNCEVKITEELIMNMCDAHERSIRNDCGPIEIVADTFENDEINELLLMNYVSKHIKLVRRTYNIMPPNVLLRE